MKNNSTDNNSAPKKEKKERLVYTTLFGGMVMRESELISLLASRDQWDD